MSHGSSTVPGYIVREINALGGNIQNAYGISLAELKAAIPAGINKINVDTDIRLAVTRNMRELFATRPELQESPSIGGVYQLLKEHPGEPRPARVPPARVRHGHVRRGRGRRPRGPRRRHRGLAVKEAVATLIVEFGSYGHYPDVELVTLEEMAERYEKAGI